MATVVNIKGWNPFEGFDSAFNTALNNVLSQKAEEKRQQNQLAMQKELIDYKAEAKAKKDQTLIDSVAEDILRRYDLQGVKRTPELEQSANVEARLAVYNVKLPERIADSDAYNVKKAQDALKFKTDMQQYTINANKIRTAEEETKYKADTITRIANIIKGNPQFRPLIIDEDGKVSEDPDVLLKAATWMYENQKDFLDVMFAADDKKTQLYVTPEAAASGKIGVGDFSANRNNKYSVPLSQAKILDDIRGAALSGKAKTDVENVNTWLQQNGFSFDKLPVGSNGYATLRSYADPDRTGAVDEMIKETFTRPAFGGKSLLPQFTSLEVNEQAQVGTAAKETWNRVVDLVSGVDQSLVEAGYIPSGYRVLDAIKKVYQNELIQALRNTDPDDKTAALSAIGTIKEDDLFNKTIAELKSPELANLAAAGIKGRDRGTKEPPTDKAPDVPPPIPLERALQEGFVQLKIPFLMEGSAGNPAVQKAKQSLLATFPAQAELINKLFDDPNTMRELLERDPNIKALIQQQEAQALQQQGQPQPQPQQQQGLPNLNLIRNERRIPGAR